MNYDIIIIGAGPGGIFSAYELSLLKPELKIAVFEAGHVLEKRKCPIDGDKVKACIACGRFADGKLRGFVCFEECVSPKLWSIEEAKTAIAITKLAFTLYV